MTGGIIFTLVMLSLDVFAQDDKSQRPSPPAQVTANVKGTTITINYSQPSVKYRKIWGALVPYGKVWRTGANEATTFEVSSDVKVEGKQLQASKYSLFTIPGEDEWTIIFNSEPNQMGAFNKDVSKDVLKVKVIPHPSDEFTEMLTFKIDKRGRVFLYWEKLEVSFKVST